MDNLLNPAVVWFIIGFILFLFEFALPGLILFFFAIGAWVVAIVCALAGISIDFQLIIFVLVSVVSVLIFRNSLKKIFFSQKKTNTFIEDEFIGKSAKSETAISPEHGGKVSFRGTSWQAISEDTIEPNENVTITGTKSIVLIVKSTKT